MFPFKDSKASLYQDAAVCYQLSLLVTILLLMVVNIKLHCETEIKWIPNSNTDQTEMQTGFVQYFLTALFNSTNCLEVQQLHLRINDTEHCRRKLQQQQSAAIMRNFLTLHPRTFPVSLQCRQSTSNDGLCFTIQQKILLTVKLTCNHVLSRCMYVIHSLEVLFLT